VTDGPGIGQKTAHIGIGGMGGESTEHVAEVRLRIETVPRRSAAHAQEHRGGLQPALTTHVQPDRSPHGERADGAFGLALLRMSGIQRSCALMHRG
jgi:hypothetical protein